MPPTERQDRRGIALLMLLLTLVMVAVWWAITPDPSATDTATPHTAVQGQHYKGERHQWQLHPFDPNTATEEELRSLGFRDYHVRNLLRYRSKGGRWRSVEHFAKLYGLSEEDYARLRPYLLLPHEGEQSHYTDNKYQRAHTDSTTHGYTPRYEVIAKLQAGERIDLATADTATLKRIPGVGSTYARRIVKYREALGGFTHLSQLDEVPDLPADVATYCTLSHAPVQAINVNTATYGQLIRHPYLNDTLVRTITHYRQHYGTFRSVGQVLQLLPADTREQLKPYLTTHS